MTEKQEDIRGIIYFPCCPKEKVIAYTSSHGRSSVKCPNCRSFTLIDYDAMTATKIHAVKGAVAKLNLKMHTD